MIHLSKGNRYSSIRDDGKRVNMEGILCQDQRCQLPRGHDATHAYQEITCHECLKLMLQEYVEKASFCSWTLKNTKYVKPDGFRFPKLGRGKKEPRFPVDPEIMRRIQAGC
jgi:hypothetical protein